MCAASSRRCRTPVTPGPWGIEVLNKAQRAWPLDELTTRAYATTRGQFRD